MRTLNILTLLLITLLMAGCGLVKTNYYLMRGNGYAANRRYEPAIESYTRALEIGPESANAYYYRGFAYDAIGEYDLAIADFTRALELDQKFVDAYYYRGYAYSFKGEYDLAIADYNRALEIDPKFAFAYNDRGIAYESKGEYDLAIADYNRALELDSKKAFIYSNRGAAYVSKGECDLAIADYSKALELDPEVGYYNNRGMAYGIKGEYDLAIADFTRALEIAPKSAFAYNNRGTVHHSKGEYDLAIADYYRALQIDSKNYIREYAYLLMLISAGKTDRASYEKVSQRFRDYVKSNSSTKWIRTVTRYYLDMDGISEEDVLAEARKGKTKNEINGRLCEAYYYLGEKRLYKNDRKGAEEFFMKSLEINKFDNFTVYSLSKAMLERLRKEKPGD